jgi:hypothetical protein
MERSGLRQMSLLFFLSGGLIHLLLFRWFVWNSQPHGESANFANHAAINIAAFVLPGLSVAWFMSRLLRRGFRVQPESAQSIVVKGCLYGVLATTVGLESFYFFCALGLTVLDLRGQGFLMLLWGVQLSFVEMNGYGVVLLARAVPFALAYGALSGVLSQRVHERRLRSSTAP